MKLRREVRLSFYCSLALLIGPYYDGWTSTTEVLIRSGIYENKCEKHEIEKVTEPGKPKCDAQLVGVGGLLFVFRASEFFSSIFLGIVMDNLGPKLLVLMGIAFSAISWIVFAFFPSVDALIIFACVLSGFSVNAIALTIYTVARYPKVNREVCMCSISACLSLGTFLTLLMSVLSDALPSVSMRSIILTMLVVIHLPFFLSCAFIFPRNLIKDVELNETQIAECSLADGSVTPVKMELSGISKVWGLRVFIKELMKTDILLITLVFVVNCISLTFVQETYPIVYAGNKVATTVNSVMVQCSFLFSLICMWIIAKYGAIIVIAFSNIVVSLAHLCLLFKSTASGISASIGISIAYSGFITYFFIYLEKVVDILYSGSVKGYMMTLGGITLGIGLISNFVIGTNEGALMGLHIGMMILRVLLMLPLAYLFVIERRGMSSVKV